MAVRQKLPTHVCGIVAAVEEGHQILGHGERGYRGLERRLPLEDVGERLFAAAVPVVTGIIVIIGTTVILGGRIRTSADGSRASGTGITVSATSLQ